MKVVGLFELNVLFVVVGGALLWALRGWATWRALISEAGLAWVVGVAAEGVVTTLALVAGFGLSYTTILVIAFAVITVGVAAGVRRKAPFPRGRGRISRPRDGADYVGVVAAGIAFIVAVAMLRAVWNQPLIAWDAWSFWVTKAKVIYYFGGLWGTGVAIVIGFMWVLWSDPTVPLTTVPAQTPIPRAVGAQRSRCYRRRCCCGPSLRTGRIRCST